jgi:hypothetical protein
LYEYTNENADALLSVLNEKGVKTFDMRQLMKEDGLDWYASFYKTDAHWTTRTGLWCASKIAELLNENSGCEYDLSLFNEGAYEITAYDNFWYGSWARTIHLVGCEKDSFEVIIPTYNTDFEISIPSQNYYEKGTYQQVMIRTKLLDEIKGYNDTDFLHQYDPYHISTWRNHALGTIKNNSTSDNKDKKILIIQNSLGWYSSSFLACDTGEIDLIHPSEFTGSIREYVNQTEPDIVIIMPDQAQISANSVFCDIK